MYTHTFIDSCAFSPTEQESVAAREILEHAPHAIVAHSVQKEIDHPNTPDDVKRLASAFIYTIETDLTDSQRRVRTEIRAFIQGNANPDRHKSDADHIFELHNYGGGYFVTIDQRLLSKSDELFERYSVTTISPSEYVKLL